MTSKIVSNIFGKNEIFTEEKLFRFIEKNRIVIFVPEEFADKIMMEMSGAGAGSIGNYEMCSFRTAGTGTFKPGKRAEPFQGKRNKISYAKEVRLEMEFETGKLNSVLDVMLKHHPYEEVVYDIFSFIRREKEISGIIINLKKKISHAELLKKLNKKIKETVNDEDIFYDKIAFTDKYTDENLYRSAKLSGCGCLISLTKNGFKLYKIL